MRYFTGKLLLEEVKVVAVFVAVLPVPIFGWDPGIGTAPELVERVEELDVCACWF